MILAAFRRPDFFAEGRAGMEGVIVAVSLSP